MRRNGIDVGDVSLRRIYVKSEERVLKVALTVVYSDLDLTCLLVLAQDNIHVVDGD